MMVKLIEQLILNPSFDSWLCSVIGSLIFLAAITRPAQGLYVGNVRRSPGDNGDNMIGREFLFLAAANTAIIVLLTKGFPFFGRVTSARFRFSSAAAVLLDSRLFGVVLAPTLKVRPVFIWVGYAPPLFTITLLSRVSFIPFAAFLSVIIGIVPLPFFYPGTITLPALSVFSLKPLICPTPLARLPVSFCHNKKLLYLAAKGVLDYNLFCGQFLKPIGRRVLGLLKQSLGLLIYCPYFTTIRYQYQREVLSWRVVL